MTIHIGELIEERLNERGMTKAELGRRIGTSRQNVALILEKQSLDTAQLMKKLYQYDSNDLL